jgi:hypothetical protein
MVCKKNEKNKMKILIVLLQGQLKNKAPEEANKAQKLGHRQDKSKYS